MARPRRLENANEFIQFLTWTTTRERFPFFADCPEATQLCLKAFESDWDTAMRDEVQLRNTIEYLHANPIRARLVKKLEDYPYSSAGFYVCGRPSIIKISPPPL